MSPAIIRFPFIAIRSFAGSNNTPHPQRTQRDRKPERSTDVRRCCGGCHAEMGELLKETLGLQLLHWAFVGRRSEVWCTASRCAVDFMNGIHEPLERSAAVLDGILTDDDEEEETDKETHRNEAEDSEEDEDTDCLRWDEFGGDYEARRDMWLNGLEMQHPVQQQRHRFGYNDDHRNNSRNAGEWNSSLTHLG